MKSSISFILLAVLSVCVLPSLSAGRRQNRPPSAWRSQVQDQVNQLDDNDGIQQVAAVVAQDHPEAVTPKGTFRGFKKTVDGTDVYIFYGIPFAKPPVDGLRFKKPQQADKLEETFDAISQPNACPQTIGNIYNDFAGEKLWIPKANMSEDCLYLNLWVPAAVFETKNVELAPVINWIYGGGFFSGASSIEMYDGANLAAAQGVVVVSAQYRVGPLGFLYLGVDDAPGNMGLLDQTLALRWVRDNIEFFGGDRKLVTIAGESCGSASVGFHLVSPLSKKYFKRGILASGLPNQNYAIKPAEEIKSRSLKIAKLAGCNQKDYADIIACLRKVDTDKLSELQWKLYKHILDFPFTPVIDGHFLLDHPDKVIARGKAKRAEVLLGTVKDEGTYFILYHLMKHFSHLKPTSVPYDQYLETMEDIFHSYSETEREAIIAQYTNWINPEDGYVNQKKIGEAVGEAWFTCPHKKFADNWANRGLGVYYYHLTHRYTTNPWGQWMGVMHGDDIPLLFGNSGLNITFSDKEKLMNANFMQMVGNFARTGVPSYNWERYTSEYPAYIDINATVITDASTPDQLGPKAQECAFWNKILPLLHEKQNNARSQFGHSNKPRSACHPRWNPNGQGIHGGNGFQNNQLNSCQQPCYRTQYQFQQPPSCQYPTQPEGLSGDDSEETANPPAV